MKKYRVNSFCPHCGEEHCYWTVTLSDEEQEALDNYYKSREEHRKHQTAIANMSDDIATKPVIIRRQFKCGACKQEFEATVTVFRENEIGYRSSDMIPMGEYPV